MEKEIQMGLILWFVMEWIHAAADERANEKF